MWQAKAASIPDEFFEDLETELHQREAERARENIDPSDALAYTIHELLALADDTQNPLWHLVRHCATVGTPKETGRSPSMVEQVGSAFLPLIEKAILKLTQEALETSGGF